MRFVTSFLQKEQCLEGTRHNPAQNKLGGGDFWQETLRYIRITDHFLGGKQVSQREHWRYLRVEDTQIF